MSAIENILNNVEGVRQRGKHQWIARCPSHDDRGPSLSIRDDGDKVLIHCFAGCPPAEVLGAIGLSLGDLFEDKLDDFAGTGRQFRTPPGVLLELLRESAMTLYMAHIHYKEGGTFDDDDERTINNATARILEATNFVRLR